MEQINEVIEVLKALGYEPKHNEEKRDIYFTSFGFESFPERHKKVVRVLLISSIVIIKYARRGGSSVTFSRAFLACADILSASGKMYTTGNVQR